MLPASRWEVNLGLVDATALSLLTASRPPLDDFFTRFHDCTALPHTLSRPDRRATASPDPPTLLLLHHPSHARTGVAGPHQPLRGRLDALRRHSTLHPDLRRLVCLPSLPLASGPKAQQGLGQEEAWQEAVGVEKEGQGG